MSDPIPWDLPSVVRLPDLGQLGDTVSDGAGQSIAINQLDEHPGYLVKLYKTPGSPDEGRRLDLLIGLPGTDDGPRLEVLTTSTSWPVARVEDEGGRSVGCVIPKAPDRFRVTLDLGGRLSEKFLEVDLLAKSDEAFARRKLPAPTPQQRLAVCRNIAAVAAALETRQLVYSDWSYSNAFWSGTDQSVFVIDIDGCAIAENLNIYQPNWEDPLTPRTHSADTFADRYRVGLLVARCLTGRRDLPGALHALDDSARKLGQLGLAEVLQDILLATERRHRPSMARLDTVLSGGPYVRMRIDRRPMPLPPAPPRKATPIPAARPVDGAPKVNWRTANQDQYRAPVGIPIPSQQGLGPPTRMSGASRMMIAFGVLLGLITFVALVASQH